MIGIKIEFICLFWYPFILYSWSLSPYFKKSPIRPYPSIQMSSDIKLGSNVAPTLPSGVYPTLASSLNLKEYPNDDFSHILGYGDSNHQLSRLQDICGIRLKDVNQDKKPIDTVRYQLSCNQTMYNSISMTVVITYGLCDRMDSHIYFTVCTILISSIYMNN